MKRNSQIQYLIAGRWFFSTVSFCCVLIGGLTTGVSADVVWNAPTAGETVTQSGNFATGTQTAEKTGAGTYLINNSSNTSTGQITISAGGLKVNGAKLFGPISISNGGTLLFGGQNALGLNADVPAITVNAGGVIDNGAAGYSNLNQLTLNGGSITASNPTSNVMGDFLLGSSLTVTANSAISANVMLRTQTVYADSGKWDVQGSSVLTVSGKLSLLDGGYSQTAKLTKSGTGTILFTAGSDRAPTGSYVVINNGTIKLKAADALGKATISVNKTAEGTGALTFSGVSGTTQNNIALASGTTFSIRGTGGGVNGDNIYALAGNLSGAGTVDVSGTYTDLSGNNSGFSGTLKTANGWTFLLNAQASSASATFNNLGGLYPVSSLANQVYQFGMLTGTGEFRASGRASDIPFAIEVGANNASGSYSGKFLDNGNRKFSVTKKGTGTWTLSSAESTYSLGASIDTGTVAISASSTLNNGTVSQGPLGTGTVTLNGGTLSAVTNNVTLHNSINVAKDSTINATKDLTLSGNLTGSANLTKTGNSLFFTGDNSQYSGTITLGGGNTFILGASASLASASMVLNNGLFLIGTTEGAIFDFGMITGSADFRPSDRTKNEFHVVNLSARVGGNNASGTMNGLISNLYSGTNFGLIKVGTGTWTLTNSGNYYPGGTTISEGTIAIQNGTTFDNVANTITKGPLGTGAVTLNGGKLLYNNSSADATLAYNFVAVANMSSSISSSQGKTLVLSGQLTGTGSLDNQGSNGYVQYTGDNSGFHGEYTNLSRWTFFVTPQSSSETAIYHAGTGSAVVSDQGFAFLTTSATENTFKLGMLTGVQEVRSSGASVGPIVLEVGGPSANGDEALRQQYSQRYSGVFSGYLNDCWDGKITNIVKVGEGVWTLSGDQLNYSGTTTIKGGTLKLEGTLKNSSITIEDGGILSGTGEIAHSLLIKSGGTLEVDLRDSAKENVLEAGSVTMSKGSVISFAEISDPASLQGVELVLLKSDDWTTTNLDDILIDFSNLGSGSWNVYFNPGAIGAAGAIVMRSDDSKVPEPASIVLLIFGAAGIGLFRRRR